MLKIYTSILMMAIISVSPASLAADVLTQTKAMIAAMQKIDANADKKNRHQAFSEVDKFIDFEQLSSNTIQPHLSKFNAAQVSDFKQHFKQLIRLIAYPDSGTFFSVNSYTYDVAEINGDKAEIHMEVLVKEEDLDMDIGFNWHKKGTDWLLTDMSIDEDSLVKDYQNQFGRLIDKENVAGLLKKIKQKLAELDQ